MADAGDPLYIFTISCPDRTGIVAAVAGFLADHDAFITEVLALRRSTNAALLYDIPAIASNHPDLEIIGSLARHRLSSPAGDSRA